MRSRKALCILLILLLASSFSVRALAAVDLGDPQYVVDDAGVLSPEIEQKILDTNEMLWKECSGAEFVVVTVNYPPAGTDREEFAKKIFDTWHIGSADEDNGMLLVLYTESDDFWLQPGEGVFSSAYVDEIADLVSDDSDFYKALRKDKDEEAVSLLLEGVTKWYRAHYRSAGGSAGSTGSAFSGDPEREISDREALFILLFIILVYIVITSPFRCRRKWGHWGVWPVYYLSPWWRTRKRVIRPMRYRVTSGRIPDRPGYSRPPTGFGSRPSGNSYSRPSGSSSYSRPSGSSSRPSGGGFSRPSSGSRPSGGFSGRPGGGGRSGSGGFGHR